MGVNHYENFPVASLLLPPRFRHPVALIYRFAREADDLRRRGRRPRRRPARAAGAIPRATAQDRARRTAADIRLVRGTRRGDPRARSAAAAVRRPAVGVLPRMSPRSATPSFPKCSITAGARRIRSGGCCCTCSAARATENLAAVGLDLLGAAARQFLAGRGDRLREGPHLPAAGRNEALRRDRTAHRRAALRRRMARAHPVPGRARARHAASRARRSGARCPAASGSRSAPPCRAGCAFWRSWSARSATCFGTGQS